MYSLFTSSCCPPVNGTQMNSAPKLSSAPIEPIQFAKVKNHPGFNPNSQSLNGFRVNAASQTIAEPPIEKNNLNNIKHSTPAINSKLIKRLECCILIKHGFNVYQACNKVGISQTSFCSEGWLQMYEKKGPTLILKDSHREIVKEIPQKPKRRFCKMAVQAIHERGIKNAGSDSRGFLHLGGYETCYDKRN